MRKWVLRLLATLVVAATIAGLLTKLSGPQSFEERMLRHALVEEAQKADPSCPMGICDLHKLQTAVAHATYPEAAAKVFAVYGNEPELAEVMRYGPDIFPVVAFFVEHGSREMFLKESFAKSINAGNVQWANVSAEQYGLIAIAMLKGRGHELLAEFVITDGRAERVQIIRAFNTVKNLFAGGVISLETIWRRGDMPKWKDVGLAALDATVFFGGVGAITKALGASKVAVGTVKHGSKLHALGVASSGAFKAIGIAGKTAVQVAPLAFAYIAVTHPQLIASAGGWVAEQTGLPRWTGIFTVYMIGLFALIVLVRPLLWVVRMLLIPLRPVLRYVG